MNSFLNQLLRSIAIDITHLKEEYLSHSELDYLNRILKSAHDLNSDFYTNEHGEKLECLLYFLTSHSSAISSLMCDNTRSEILIELYTSPTISGNYDCFRFDLSKFPQTYASKNQELTLYRIGRETENDKDLGCSWATTIDGLNAYCGASGLSKEMLKSRPIFVSKVDDNQVLFRGKSVEEELVLKHDFTFNSLIAADEILRRKIG